MAARCTDCGTRWAQQFGRCRRCQNTRSGLRPGSPRTGLGPRARRPAAPSAGPSWWLGVSPLRFTERATHVLGQDDRKEAQA